MAELDPRADRVLKYWFGDGYTNWPSDYSNKDAFLRWFKADPEVDQEIKTMFSGDVEALKNGELNHWLAYHWNTLAGLILMDQFTRNMFRGTPEMYSLDDTARQWAATLAADPEYLNFHPAQKMFVFLPFTHGESLADQEQCVALAAASAEDTKARLGEDAELTFFTEMTLKSAYEHKELIEKWGRFPHRNAVLGRESTPEELKGLEDGTIAKF